MPVPVTLRVPPSVVAPELTLKVLEPVTAVLPLSETLPVPVENVPLPLCEKLPDVVRSPDIAAVPEVEMPFEVTAK